MNLVKNLSNPVVYRRLIVLGILTFALGGLLMSIPVTFLGVAIVALSKYGMRKEHRGKLKIVEQDSPLENKNHS